MGQASSSDAIPEPYVREISSPTQVRRYLPEDRPYDDDYAKELESFIAQHSRTITKIELFNKDRTSELQTDPTAPNLYVEAAVRGMLRGKSQADAPALEELHFFCYSAFELNQSLLTRILLVAPKKLTLASRSIHMDDVSELSWDDNNTNTNTCQLEELKINACTNEAFFVLLVKLLAKMTPLKKVTFEVTNEESRNTRGGSSKFKASAPLTSAFVDLLERSPDMHYLRITQFLPEMEPFCQQIKRSSNLSTLEIPCLNVKGMDPKDFDDYLKELVLVLKNTDLILERLDYKDRRCTEQSRCGSFDIGYYLLLNKDGNRRKMLKANLSGAEFIQTIAPHCSYKRPATVEEVAAGMPDGDNVLAGFLVQMMPSEENLLYRDTIVRYGLLRASPGVWSEMAALADRCSSTNTKPSAKSTSKGQATKEEELSNPKKRRTSSSRNEKKATLL